MIGYKWQLGELGCWSFYSEACSPVIYARTCSLKKRLDVILIQNHCHLSEWVYRLTANHSNPSTFICWPWASCQIRKITGCACTGNAGNVSPATAVSDPDMHRATCATPVPWCMPGSLTSVFLWSRWRGKRSRHSPHMRNPQFYVSGKRSIAYVLKKGVSACGVLSCSMSMNTENASKMEIPRDNFSPESTGTTKIRADRAAKTTVGMMMFTK